MRSSGTPSTAPSSSRTSTTTRTRCTTRPARATSTSPKCNDAADDVDQRRRRPAGPRAPADRPVGGRARRDHRAADRVGRRRPATSASSRATATGFGSFDPALFDVQRARRAPQRASSSRSRRRTSCATPAKWDGFVDVTLSVTVTTAGRRGRDRRRRAAARRAGDDLPPPPRRRDAVRLRDVGERDPRRRCSAHRSRGRRARRPACRTRRTLSRVWDQWTQDFFETGVHVDAGRRRRSSTSCASNFRSANVYYPKRREEPAPRRRAASCSHAPRQGRRRRSSSTTSASDGDMDSLNSFGNLETIPPYTHRRAELPARAHPSAARRPHVLPGHELREDDGGAGRPAAGLRRHVVAARRARRRDRVAS